VTSSYWSEALGHPFALAMVADGRSRYGDSVEVPLAHGAVAATITEPVFVDKENARRDG
jgi:sarcosine oxidase subunit alpha